MTTPPPGPVAHGPAEVTDVALVVPIRDGRVFVARRADGSHLAGTWEFPGGRVDPAEEPPAAARRELSEETGLVASTLEPLSVFVHEYPDRTLRFHVYIARDVEGDVALDADRAWAWVDWERLRALAMPEANRGIVGALRWRLAR